MAECYLTITLVLNLRSQDFLLIFYNVNTALTQNKRHNIPPWDIGVKRSSPSSLLNNWLFFTWSHSCSPAVLCISVCLPSCQEILLCRNDRPLCSLPVEAFFIPVGRHHRLPLDFLTLSLPKEKTHQVVLLLHFSPNRGIWECFESAVCFLAGLHFNNEEPVFLNHMLRHPLINATLCCVTKSQLHRAFYDWSALTVVDGI